MYGDLLIWFQMIDKAKQSKMPIIFITDDNKSDWWYETKGSTLGPYPELIDEMYTKAQVAFYMYRSNQFMEYAHKILQEDVKKSAIDEVKSMLENIERHSKQVINDSDFVWGITTNEQDNLRKSRFDQLFYNFNQNSLNDDYNIDEDINNELIDNRILIENNKIKQEIRFLINTKLYSNEDLVHYVQNSLAFFKYIKDIETVNKRLRALRSYLINYIE